MSPNEKVYLILICIYLLVIFVIFIRLAGIAEQVAQHCKRSKEWQAQVLYQLQKQHQTLLDWERDGLPVITPKARQRA